MASTERGVLALTLALPGWVFALFVIIGLGIAVPAEVMFERAWRLQMGGASVEGQVSRLWITTHTCGKGNLDICTDYNVAFAFDSGTWRQTQTKVSQGFYGGLTEGGPIAVRYVRDDPTIIEVEYGWTFFSGTLLLIFALAFLIGGGLGLRWRWLLAQRLVTLRQTGETRQATVVAQMQTTSASPATSYTGCTGAAQLVIRAKAKAGRRANCPASVPK